MTLTCPPLFLILLSTLLVFCVHAWIPPKPTKYNNHSDWESVDAMRQRLGLEFNYTPTLIHPEICRYLTEEECRTTDRNLQDHAKAHRALQNGRRHNPNLGTFKVLVLCIVFSDHVDRPRIDKSDVELMWSTLVPEWFDVNSYGLYDIDPVVTEWVVTDNTEAYYAFDKRGIVPEFQRAAWPALNALDNRGDWDWGPFDVDKDGKLDSVVITHSGYGAETREADEYGTPYDNRIWAHAFANSGDLKWVSKDGSVQLNGYTVASAFEDDSGVEPATIGLTVHEYMHTFGLIDLYAPSGLGIGSFDIMANPYGPKFNANRPGHLCTWSKLEAEWNNPTVIDSDGIYTMQPLPLSNDAYKIVINSFGSAEEYLLLENRQKLEFDVDLYGTGIAIYHIDDAKDGQKQVGYPGYEVDGVAWPENGHHYEVAMLAPDGEYHLEKGENYGDAGDLWQPGQELGPGKGNSVFPNTDAYMDGWVFESNVVIKVLEPEGEVVRFEVSGLGGGSQNAEPETPAPTSAAPTVGPTSAAPTVGPTAGATTANPTVGATTAGPVAAPTVAATTASPTSGMSQAASTTSPTVSVTTAAPSDNTVIVDATLAPSTGSPTGSSPTTSTTTPAPSTSTSVPTSSGASFPNAADDGSVTTDGTLVPGQTDNATAPPNATEGPRPWADNATTTSSAISTTFSALLVGCSSLLGVCMSLLLGF